MPIIKSAIKRAKQTLKRRERNVSIKRDIKSAVKAFLAEPGAQTLAAAHSELDTAVKKGLLNKNTAARRKATLSAAAKTANVKLAKKPVQRAATPAKSTVKTPAKTKEAAAKNAPAKRSTPKKSAK